VIFSKTGADDDIELDAFGVQGVSIKFSNGTVSEHTPFMASIRLRNQEMTERFGYGHFCAGVYVSRQHILTLASCLSRSSVIMPEEIEVIGGTRYRYDNSYAKVYLINRITLHPDYAVTDLRNNVAILFLNEETPEEFLTISSILISHDPITVGQNLQIYGWGTPLVDDGPRELLTGRITVVNRTECHETFVNRFCAGPRFFGGCQGDDGGAVVSKGLLYGLVDYRSSEYCQSSIPAHLYIDVAAHREWIETIVFGMPLTTTSTTQGGSKQTISFLMISSIFFILKLLI